MEFEESLMSRQLSRNIDDVLALSNPKFKPSGSLGFDEFVDNVGIFHSPSLDPTLVQAVSNNNEPIYQLMDVTVQLDSNNLETETVIENDQMPAME